MAKLLRKLSSENPNPPYNHEFSDDVDKGLSHQPKSLLSKYFYDEIGSDLFNQITHSATYYLTNCELEILETNKAEFSQLFTQESFNLIELGPGEGIKAKILIEQFLKDEREFTYFTIDISRKYLNQIIKQFHTDLPKLKLRAINSDYCKGIKWLSTHSKRRNIVLFLGSSIGNFDTENAIKFLHEVWHDLQNGDYFLIGFDLKKDPNQLVKAYNDPITQEFNFNLLRRINKELEGNFDVPSFQHYATYNVYLGAMESYLMSLKSQEVYINTLKKTFHFYELEPIHMENSYKYSLSQIEEFANITGFKIIKNFLDNNGYFVNSLWQVTK